MENTTAAAASCTPSPNNYFVRRIDRTTYKVSVAFSETCMETLEEKILRLIRHEVLDNSVILRGSEATNTEQIENLPVCIRRMLDIRRAEHGIMTVPQMSCQSERSN